MLRHVAIFILLSFSLIGFSCGDSAVPPGSVIDATGDVGDFLGTGEYLGEYWPTDGWRTCRPEEVGMSSNRLAEVYRYAANPNIITEGILVVRDGYIVGEAYFRGYTPARQHYSFSVAKSFTSAVMGIAIDRGYIADLDEPVYQYFPDWQEPGTDPRKQRITLDHLLHMNSGIQWDESDYNSHDNDAYMMHNQYDMNQYVLDKPMEHEPGTYWRYSTGNSQLLSGVIWVATGSTAYTFAMDHLLRPIGLENVRWDSDLAGNTATGSGVRATLREFAKFGYLYMKNGEWDGQQIVPESWIELSHQPAMDGVTMYGLHWWLKPAIDRDGTTSISDNLLIAWGIHTQQIFVMPDQGLLVVRIGNDPEVQGIEWVESDVLTLVLNALQE